MYNFLLATEFELIVYILKLISRMRVLNEGFRHFGYTWTDNQDR